MMNQSQAIGPAARTARFLLFTLGIAGAILWAIQAIDPRPWIVLRFCGQELRAALAGHSPEWHQFVTAYRYLAASWIASLSIGAALFVGGVGARWLDRMIVRWNRMP